MHAHATTLPSACQSRDEVRAPFADLRRRCADPFDVRGSKVKQEDDMTRIELTSRLGRIAQIHTIENMRARINDLLEDIKLDGVLDVQQPPRMLSDEEIASCFRDTCGGGIDRTGVASDINRFVIATVRRLLERQQQPPALIDVRAIKARGHVTLEELQSMTVQDIATFSKR
jgi:hypothetical protein